MSSQNGDKARFHKLRRKKLHRRELMAKMANRAAAKANQAAKLPTQLQ